jgi:hypothetical protein
MRHPTLGEAEPCRKTAGVVGSLAAILSAPAMGHQCGVQHEQLPAVFCQSQDIIQIMLFSYLCHFGIVFHHITYVNRLKFTDYLVF